MEKILICPGERPAVGFLSQSVPLVAMPMLGESLLGYWMESLASAGAKELLVLATDWPELVRAVVGDGSRWGVRACARAELKELTLAEVCAKLAEENGSVPDPRTDMIKVDHLTGLEEASLFRTYHDWFSAVLAWMPRPASSNRLGLREIAPQVWCGQPTHVAPTARLQAPCWLGDNVQVGPNAVIGPNAVLENRVAVDAASEIRWSVIGPDTFVGALIKIENSIAWGSTLIDWRTGSCTRVPDAFLLSALGQRYLPDCQPERRGWLRRTFGSVLAHTGLPNSGKMGRG
jgi:NDP-sugar pyrophosphorylase family protein